jgi:hypothetical protein
MRHRTRLLAALFPGAIFFVFAAGCYGATVNWAAQGERAVVVANGTSAVPVGSLTRLGYFDIDDSQIVANASSLTFLDSHFVEFAGAHMGDGTESAGSFASSSDNNELNFPGQPIHIWVFNTSALSNATQHGIFDAPNNGDWMFPPQEPIPWFTSVDLGDASMQPVVGSLGGPINISNNGFASTAVLASIGTNLTSNGGTLQFSPARYSVMEAETTVTITVTRSGGTGDVSVNFASANGTAHADVNYEAASGTLNFTNGQTSASFDVAIRDDQLFAGNCTVRLLLSNPTGNATLGASSNAVLTIIESQPSPGSARVDVLQRELDAISDCAGNAALSLLASNRTTAATDFSSCVGAAQQLLSDSNAQTTIDALGSKGATGLQKKIGALLKTLNAMETLFNNVSQSDAKALKGLRKASSMLAKTKNWLLKFSAQAPFVMLEELKGRGGFHRTNEVVCYRVYVFSSVRTNCAPASITVTNLPASQDRDVVESGINQINATDFCIATGSEQGVARITADACDRPSSVILFNLGP